VKKIAVFGSRKWPSLQQVALKVNELYGLHGQFILVSGGGNMGTPNHTAETTAMEFGLPVLSFRPVKLPDHDDYPVYGVDEWRLFRGSGKIIHHHEPTWADWESAAGFRSMLAVERADEGIVFWDGHSRGAGEEIDYFEAAGKSCEVIRP
jgi:hypothetical protein